MDEINLKRYANVMKEIKLRINSLALSLHDSPNDIFKIEARYLQIRKILELISLASLVANLQDALDGKSGAFLDVLKKINE